MKKTLTALALLIGGLSPAMADRMQTYRVTITNATAHQVITPPLVVAHRHGFRLFQVGEAASEGLVTLAETGDNLQLLGEVDGAHGVYSAVAGSAPIPYGQSVSIEIKAPRFALISIAGMLATTNDGFAGINGMPLPLRHSHTMAHAYDAGSEMNNESCSHIPGPPCPPESGNARTESGEGFIAIHNGIHGGSDLDPKQLDWRGPVAVVSVTRIHR